MEAEFEGFLARTLFLGDAPVQIHLDEFDLAFAAEAAQFRPGLRHQFLPFPAMSRKVEDTNTRMRRLSVMIKIEVPPSDVISRESSHRQRV